MRSTESEATEQRERVIAEVVNLEREILRAVRAATAPAWLQLDVTMAQLKALMTVADHGPLAVTSLGHALGVGAPAASYLVERLVQLGLVSRDEDPLDRRRTNVTLTGRGDESVERLRHDGPEHLREWVAHVRESDLDKLRDGLQVLVAATRQSSASRDGQARPDVAGKATTGHGVGRTDCGGP